jgi:hypothetical protein
VRSGFEKYDPRLAVESQQNQSASRKEEPILKEKEVHFYVNCMVILSASGFDCESEVDTNEEKEGSQSRRSYEVLPPPPAPLSLLSTVSINLHTFSSTY